MAKVFSFADLATEIGKVDDLGSISTENKFSEITEWVGLGNYLLNAQVSGSLFGGAPNKRSLMLAGPSGTGKTFLTLNMAREAIDRGYDVLWLDSEAAVDKHTFEKFGLDTSKIYYQPAQTIKQVAGIIANACAVIHEKIKKNFEVPKLYVVIDSLGNLSSGKERADILEGNDKRDMTKQQELGGMFRVITTDIAKVGGILVCTNHTYDSIGGYIPTINIKGGNAGIYNCSIILTLTKANLKSDKQMDGKEMDSLAEKNNIANRMGIIATSKPYKNRFAKPIPIKFHISFFKGMNPYVGLENYVSWEACGIQRGTYQEEIVEKPVLDEAGNQVIFRNKPKVEKVSTGNWVFTADDSAKGWAVKHLNRVVLPHEFFSKEVFTREVLELLNTNVIKPLFELPEIYDYEDDIVNELGLDNFSDDKPDSLNAPVVSPLNITEI